MLEIYQLGLRFFGIIGGIIYFSGLFCLLINHAKHYINDEKFTFPKWFVKINVSEMNVDDGDDCISWAAGIIAHGLITLLFVFLWFISIPIIIGYFILRLFRALVRIKKDITKIKDNIKIKTNVNMSVKKENNNGNV